MVKGGDPEQVDAVASEARVDSLVEARREALNSRLNELYRSDSFANKFEWINNTQVVKSGESNQGEPKSFNWFIMHDLMKDPRRSRILAVERDVETDLSAGELITANQVFQFGITDGEVTYNTLSFSTKRSIDSGTLEISSVSYDLQSVDKVETIDQLTSLVGGFLNVGNLNSLEFGDEELLTICTYSYNQSLLQDSDE